MAAWLDPLIGGDMNDSKTFRGITFFEDFSTNALLKYPGDENGGGGADVLVEDETGERESEEDNLIRCGQCLHAVARKEDKIAVGGAHMHTFANPNGIVFEIGCYSSADGCKYAGPPTEEFTWFKGYAWRIAVCGKCLLHLGWLYVAAGKDSFAGLIVDRLVYPQS